jgi:hypothetical protein
MSENTSKFQFLKRRERRRFTREEQLSFVCGGNLAIFAIVGIVAAATNVPARYQSLFPKGFWITELGIAAVAGILSMWDAGPLVRTFQKVMKQEWERRAEAEKTGEASLDQMREALRGASLFAVYAAQLFALRSLLFATGGPVHSPYVPLALITVIFTPFLANNPLTVVVVLLLTGLCYVVVVVTYGTSPGEAEAWLFVVINLIIVALALAPSLGELVRAETTRIPARSALLALDSPQPTHDTDGGGWVVGSAAEPDASED